MIRPPILRAWTGAIVDNFAGGGGASTGIEMALGRSPDVAINHNPIALGVHAANHPTTRHLVESVWLVDPVRATEGQPVDLAWFSPDCRHFSRAKGAPLRDQKIRGLAWSAVRWAASSARPRVIVLENVPEFATWGPLVDGMPCERRRGQTFRAFVRRLVRLGYVVDWTTLRASDFGAATSRKRLFLVARRDGAPVRWPVGDPRSALPASSVIDWSTPLPSIFERSAPYSAPTLARIVEGYRRFAGPYLIHRGNGERVGQAPRIYSLEQPLGTIVAQGIKHGLVVPFVVKHYSARGSGGPNTSASVNAPLGAITTRDHHAIAAAYCDGLSRRDHRAEIAALLGAEAVAAGVVDIGMRYLMPVELFRAQGFPPDFVFDRDAAGRSIGKTDQVRLVGNSVSPPVAAAVVRAQLEAA
ncbi:MAG: DNA cytosine methyltransferase [Kofleriaceae bacterium]